MGIPSEGATPHRNEILRDAFPPEQLGTAFAMYGMVVVAAPAIGPTIGGPLNHREKIPFFAVDQIVKANGAQVRSSLAASSTGSSQRLGTNGVTALRSALS